MPYLEAARLHLYELVFLLLAKELEDDPLAESDDESSGMGGGAVTGTVAADTEYVGAFAHYLTGSEAANVATAASPASAPPPVREWKSKETKAEELAEKAMAAWDALPAAPFPFFGQGSGEFDLQEYYGALDGARARNTDARAGTTALLLAAPN